jgi:acyl transferase domain-containing protein
LLQSELGVDIRTILFPSPHPSPEEAARVAECLEQTQFAQPALFVVEYALARLWMHWKISPQALMGHSIGEYVAACIAGVFSVRDALRVVSQRARLMQQMPPGAMLAVGASESETRTWMGAALELAAVNGPQITVVSGPIQEIDSLQERLASQGVFYHRLRTSQRGGPRPPLLRRLDG